MAYSPGAPAEQMLSKYRQEKIASEGGRMDKTCHHDTADCKTRPPSMLSLMSDKLISSLIDEDEKLIGRLWDTFLCSSRRAV